VIVEAHTPLWKPVRASTATPVYFDPKEIMPGDWPCVFVDGSITPCNNPSLIGAAGYGTKAVAWDSLKPVAIPAIRMLREIGQGYAREQVKLAHLI
jgi:hypothetical protein